MPFPKVRARQLPAVLAMRMLIRTLRAGPCFQVAYGTRRRSRMCLLRSALLRRRPCCMQMRGAGQTNEVLPTSSLQTYVRELKNKGLLGSKRAGSKRAGPPRQAYEAVRAAQLLRASRKQIQKQIVEKYDAADGSVLTTAKL
eukprot:983614-Pleurochrysis_carterae.AAC.1